jgi:hypothetical protein
MPTVHELFHHERDDQMDETDDWVEDGYKKCLHNEESLPVQLVPTCGAQDATSSWFLAAIEPSV